MCLAFSNANAQKINWKSATVEYNDGRIETGLLKSKKSNFWYYQILKVNNQNEYLYPEEVAQIVSGETRFISFVFSQKEYNHLTHSFAHVLAGNDICLLHTRVSYMVCNCNNGERYIWAYFIFNNQEYLKIETKGRRNNILNTEAVQSFLIDAGIDEISLQSILTIHSLKEFIDNQ